MSIADSVAWKLCHFEQLSAQEVYQLARLRIDVFVVEQRCPYPELDGLDLLPSTAHLYALNDTKPAAYARVLAPVRGASWQSDDSLSCVHIGRVLVARPYRRCGLATQLMHRALDYCKSHHDQHDIALAAQVDVMDFYASLGFTPCSEHYLEDGIAHVNMRRSGI